MAFFIVGKFSKLKPRPLLDRLPVLAFVKAAEGCGFACGFASTTRKPDHLKVIYAAPLVRLRGIYYTS